MVGSSQIILQKERARLPLLFPNNKTILTYFLYPIFCTLFLAPCFFQSCKMFYPRPWKKSGPQPKTWLKSWDPVNYQGQQPTPLFIIRIKGTDWLGVWVSRRLLLLTDGLTILAWIEIDCHLGTINHPATLHTQWNPVTHCCSPMVLCAAGCIPQAKLPSLHT